MNVLFVAGDADYSGATLSMIMLIRLLRRDGVICRMVLPYNGKVENELINYDIPYEVIKSYRWIKPVDETMDFKIWLKRNREKAKNVIATKKICSCIKKWNIDIVHINTLAPYVGAVSACKTNRPFIWHIREFGKEDHGQTIWDEQSGYELISKASAVITISNALQNKFIKLLPKADVRMIYNGIDIRRYIHMDKKIFDRNIVTITIAGRVSEGKGQLELVKAVEILKEKFDCFRVQIVGDGKRAYTTEIKDFILEHNLSSYIRFIGFKRNMEEVWESTDICTVCSRCEAFGRVTVEAMLAGCLVIGANSGGTAELIEDRQTGLLYQCGSPKDLAEKLSYALMNKSLMAEIAATGRLHAKDAFPAELNEKNVLQLYNEIQYH